MPSLHHRNPVALFAAICAINAAWMMPAVADTPSWVSTRIGLYGPEYTATAWNSRYTTVDYLNGAGQAAGYSYRFYETYKDQGRDSWIYNGSATVQVGLTGAAYIAANNGYRYSSLLGFNNAGQAAGVSRLMQYGTNWGDATWVYNGSNTARVGLYGAGYTRYDGYQLSELKYFNALGQAAGESEGFNPTATSNWSTGEHAWFYDGGNTVRIGMNDAAHTYADGRQYSYVWGLSDTGQVAGHSRRGYDGELDAWVYRNGVTTQIGLPTKAGDRNNYRIAMTNDSGMVAGHTDHTTSQDAWLYNGSTTVRLGLTGAGYTAANGTQVSSVNALKNSGNAVGTSIRYSGSTANGAAAWFYDGSQTTRIGLNDATHTRADGYQQSSSGALSDHGRHAIGQSYRYDGSTQIGEDAWVYDGDTTVQVGLTGGRFTMADGTQHSDASAINDRGQAIGRSMMLSPNGTLSDEAAWFYDGSETRRIGLTDTMHTRADGMQLSFASMLNEQGQVAGASVRFNGQQPVYTYEEGWGSTDVTPWLGNSAWLYDSASGQTFDMTLSVRQSDGYANSDITYLGADGMVLGKYELFAGNGTSLGDRAFYFSIADGLWDLGLLVPGLDIEGWSSLASALKANGLRNIIGTGRSNDGFAGQAGYILAPSAVPLPNAGWLLGSGLLGLAGMARRRSSRASRR